MATTAGHDRVALVTGAGSGIGRATALRLVVVDGYRVALAGRRVDALEETAALVGRPDRVLVQGCDVADEVAIGSLVAATVGRFGRLDVLVNNAGFSAKTPFADVTLTGWRHMMAVDVESVVLLTQQALPHLVETSGSVVNVASLAGLGGDPGMTAYNAAKGAVVNLTRSLAVELAPHGVRVNAVAPSLTTTDATADIGAHDLAAFVGRIPLGRAALPDDVAAVIAFLAGDDARFVTGAIVPVDGGLSASSGQPPHR